MIRTPVHVTLVALLVVLAGCNGFTGGDQPPPGNTPAPAPTPTPTETTPTERPLTAEELPPGLERSGIENATALTATNVDRLVETGYVAELQLTATLNSQGQTRNLSFHRRDTVTNNASNFLLHAERTQDGEQERATVWSNGSTTLLRTEAEGRTRYQHVDVDPRQITSQLAARELLAGYFAAGNYSITDVNRTSDQPRVTLTADRYVTQSREQLPAPANVSQFSSTIVVDLDGHIHSVTIRYVAERAERGTLTVAIQYELVQLSDVQVDRPGWVSEALTETPGMRTQLPSP